MDENALSHRILGAAIEVHRVLGPGLLESVYEEALAMELIGRGIEISRQAEVALEYKGQKLQSKLRLDMVAADLVIVEVKSLDRLTSVHEAQLLTYLRLSRKKLGLLINFNTPVLKNSVRRVVNNPVMHRSSFSFPVFLCALCGPLRPLRSQLGFPCSNA